MQRNLRAAGGKFAPAFFAANQLEAQYFPVESAHLIHLASEQDHAGHLHGTNSASSASADANQTGENKSQRAHFGPCNRLIEKEF